MVAILALQNAYILVGAVPGHTSVLAGWFRLVAVVGIFLPGLSPGYCFPKANR